MRLESGLGHTLFLGSSGGGFGSLRGCNLCLLTLLLKLLLHLTSVTEELLGGREFAETMPHHLLGNKHLNMGLAIVDPKGESDHLRANLAAACPRLNYPTSRGALILELFEEFYIHKRALFKTT